jgi:hypothetical protein
MLLGRNEPLLRCEVDAHQYVCDVISVVTEFMAGVAEVEAHQYM